MWVRSQDKRRLIKCICFEVSENRNVIFGYTKSHGISLGEYSTHEKALRVLNIIQNRILIEGIIFVMPKDEDVE